MGKGELYKILLLLGAVMATTATTYRPTVLWHGMGDSCCYPFSMGRLQKLIESELPGVYVYSIEIGNNEEEDQLNSFFKNVNEQVDDVCQKLKADPQLSSGFNAMGFSQGGQFLRAYVQRCNDPPIYNLVSVGGQHQGVFGMPRCLGNRTDLCEEMRKLLNIGAYDDFVQRHLVQAEYWQDPLNREEYLAKSVFLADINNEININETYRQNLISLNRFSLVKFTEDSMVQPRESEWFGFYKEGQDKITIDVNQTALYLNDTIGLKTLMDSDKVDFISCVGDHLQFTDQWFIENLVPLINNTL
eukprot:TRINITY_DN1165_c0_g1_i1.p1 TRINITY_DN1165_c0_g1~~TRINITY_DN1165_c0_g1_i1.p1  ORF type:complete len:302 (-),score=69.29 TRINITY_DN1165_c0_g1_i1:19-924(-)